MYIYMIIKKSKHVCLALTLESHDLHVPGGGELQPSKHVEDGVIPEIELKQT